MVTIVYNGKTNEYYGLSTDVKPTGAGLNGSAFYEMDTASLYMYDEKNNMWIKQ